MQADVLDRRPDKGEATGFCGEHLTLIGALPHMAKETFNGIGALNVWVHGGRNRRQRHQVLFVFNSAPYRFGRALSRLGECSQPSGSTPPAVSGAPRYHPVRPGSRRALVSEWPRAQCGVSATFQRWPGVAATSSPTAASHPSCPSVTRRAIWMAPRLRRSCQRPSHPCLLSSAHERLAKTAVFAVRSPPNAVTMLGEAALSP